MSGEKANFESFSSLVLIAASAPGGWTDEQTLSATGRRVDGWTGGWAGGARAWRELEREARGARLDAHRRGCAHHVEAGEELEAGDRRTGVLHDVDASRKSPHARRGVNGLGAITDRELVRLPRKDIRDVLPARTRESQEHARLHTTAWRPAFSELEFETRALYTKASSGCLGRPTHLLTSPSAIMRS